MAQNRFSPASGPSQRQLRVGELIRRTLSDILMRGEVHDEALNRMSVTVGEVRVSPDLRIATVFVMPLGGRAPQEAIVALSRHRGELRRMVSRGMTLKHAPDLRFVADETFDRMDETRRLLAEPRVQRDIADSGEETEGDGSGLV